jgi:hypothetical protein
MNTFLRIEERGKTIDESFYFSGFAGGFILNAKTAKTANELIYTTSSCHCMGLMIATKYTKYTKYWS